ncbi:MAG TPA: xylulokinase [Candidatus Pullichristensenella excrementigallinarum]|uniref:Xylulose kinase n=1 Tax=Candidatus Pullichristensenella excrementigallinarum TaxID=2840907 RepID=A0A9D1LBB1_9FIRM|nr:xylulokinase [Candidatus Pullichristensenella excrementigallinarum]
MAKRYLIGLDIGTSGAKCILVEESGEVVASSTQEYPLFTPRPGWAEQNPSDWWDAVVRGLRSILGKSDVPQEQIVGVSFSGQMHGLVALDKDHAVIRPAILWCDGRTQRQCDWITEKAGGLEGLLRYTNNQMLAGYTGGKILWLQEEEPENYEKMVCFVCPKDYIRFKLSGELGIDASDASGTGFFNTRERRWSDELISLVGLDRRVFPEVLESTDLAGRVTRAAAEETGLREGIPVFAGGGDAVIQTTGAGLVKPGVVGVVIGTAGNVSMALDRYFDNPAGALQMFCNNEAGLWQAIGCTLAAGGSYRWYRDTLCEHLKELANAGKGNVYDLMGDLAAQSRPGANGVVFAPYMSGERCPYPDPNARGLFYGLSLSSTRADITRSVMEGVTYSLKQVADIMAKFYPAEKIYTSGGGSASALWRQMQADIFDLPVYTMSAASEGGAYGAIMVAGVGAGVWKDLEEATGIVRPVTETLPNRENQKAYRDAYAMYCELYQALKPVYDKGASLGFGMGE